MLMKIFLISAVNAVGNSLIYMLDKIKMPREIEA